MVSNRRAVNQSTSKGRLSVALGRTGTAVGLCTLQLLAMCAVDKAKASERESTGTVLRMCRPCILDPFLAAAARLPCILLIASTLTQNHRVLLVAEVENFSL